MDEAHVSYEILAYDGPSTEKSFQYVESLARKFEADTIICIGGRRVIDSQIEQGMASIL